MSKLATLVEDYLKEYLEAHAGHLPEGKLHQLVMDQVEKSLLSAVMTHVQGNQTRASRLLGIHRNTLARKL
jgi:Fis family transcriptional regulator